jgi:hypothetical protein
MTTINISGLDKAEVLAALFNASRQQGMGFMHGEGLGLMAVSDARDLLKHETYFDYLRGRVMKIAIEDDLRAAERAIAPLRAKVATKAVETTSRKYVDDAPLAPHVAWPFPTASATVEPAPEREPAFSSGGGGDFGGGGASSSWSDSSSSSSSSSDSSSSSSSDSGSCSSSSSD